MRNIYLAGYGAVGQGFHTIVKSKKALHRLAGVLVRTPAKYTDFQLPHIQSFAESIGTLPNEVLVEVISDSEAAFQLLDTALYAGIPAISANKKAIAQNLAHLVNVQKFTKTPLLYEAAVAGSIPIIRILEEYFHSETLHQIRGIINGSSNYILSAMHLKQWTYAEALKEAQRLQFAEEDPFLDVSGGDACNKLVILICHAFGLIIQPQHVFTFGINHIHPTDFKVAKRNGFAIKLEAFAALNGTKIEARVCPAFLDQSDILADIEWENNCIALKTEYADEQSYFGRGAGSLPTGTAVMSDFQALQRGYAYTYSKYQSANGLEFDTHAPIHVLLASNSIESLLDLGYESRQIHHIEDRYYLQISTHIEYCVQNSAFLHKSGIALFALRSPIEIQ